MPERDAETERIRLIYDRKAGRQAGRSRPAGADVRWLCTQAEGDTLEVGIGRGRTLPHYPRTVHLHGIDISPAALAFAARRAAELALTVQLQEGDAAALPYADEQFDTVVFCFSLCTIPDDRKAIAEAARVLRPCGRLLLVEHVRSPRAVVRATQRLVEPVFARRAGDLLARDPLDHVAAEGLEIEFLERRLLGTVERLVARKPEADVLEEAV
jgi:SAM-dependent methyltransferase